MGRCGRPGVVSWVWTGEYTTTPAMDGSENHRLSPVGAEAVGDVGVRRETRGGGGGGKPGDGGEHLMCHRRNVGVRSLAATGYGVFWRGGMRGGLEGG